MVMDVHYYTLFRSFNIGLEALKRTIMGDEENIILGHTFLSTLSAMRNADPNSSFITYSPE